MATQGVPAWAQPYSFTEWTANPPTPYIGKCHTCKRVIRITITQLKMLGEHGGRLTFLYRYEVPKGCYEYRSQGLPAFTMACPTCNPEGYLGGPGATLRKIDGYLSENKKCDRRCTGATGVVCECSCAGENHGCDHVV
jgi:hypothetical protein